jgi:hypothetical protein
MIEGLARNWGGHFFEKGNFEKGNDDPLPLEGVVLILRHA